MYGWIFTHHADLTSDRLASIADDVYCLDWYKYPAEIRKDLILIITLSQEDVIFTAFDIIHCTTINFGKVNVLLAYINFICSFKCILIRIFADSQLSLVLLFDLQGIIGLKIPSKKSDG